MNVNARLKIAGLLAVVCCCQGALAQQQQMDQDQSRQEVKSQQRDQIYGYELMTEQERREHREKMRSMNSAEEREAYLARHHEEMQRRAREQGVDIPAATRGPGQGQGKAMGHKGQGPDKGKGHGKSKGPGKGL